jgi:ferrous iron transport protein B
VSSSTLRSSFIAIVGNPNAGKTTLFNSLTGSHQKVGNYPGVTVEQVSGYLQVHGDRVECVDIPGLYSLNAVSEDERVAVEAIEGKYHGGEKPDLLVCVVDASNLERNLFLYSQVATLGIPIVVALTMVDRVSKAGQQLDLAKLRNLLGTEVVPVVGHREKGLDELRDAIARTIDSPSQPDLDLRLPIEAKAKVASLSERLARMGEDVPKAEITRWLMSEDSEIQRYAKDFPELEDDFEDARRVLRGAIADPDVTTETRYRWSAMVARAGIQSPEATKNRTFTDRLDSVLTNRVWGFAIFLGVMYLVFQSIYSFAKPLMDGITWGFSEMGNYIGPKLAGVPILQSLVVDGLINGVGGMLVFLPQILILFFFIAVLEGTGYLARAAFMMDRLLGWCGLNGRAFIPLLSSFACAIPGIMAARVMPDPKARLATILVAPLMSCSARLPVYLLLIGIFVEPKYGPIWAGIALFGMHFVGLLFAIPIVFVLNRKVLKGSRLPFLLELPPYQLPKWKDVWLAMYFRGRLFVKTAGTIIVLMSVVIWALSYFPRSNEQESKWRQQFKETRIARRLPAEGSKFQSAEDRFVDQERLASSYLGRFGKALEPAFIPAGFDWRLTTGILSAFPARETVVSSLGIIFNLGGDVDEGSNDLRGAISKATWPDGRPLLNLWTAMGLMVFFALCCQCASTLATIRRETNSWKWPLFVFVYMTTLAYLSAVGINYLGKAFGA